MRGHLAVRIERGLQETVPQALPPSVFQIRGLLGLGAHDGVLEGTRELVTSGPSSPPSRSLAVAAVGSQWAGTLPPSFPLRL